MRYRGVILGLWVGVLAGCGTAFGVGAPPQHNAKQQFEAQVRYLKHHKGAFSKLSRAKQMHLMQEYIRYDKRALLAKYHGAEDVGFAGSLFVQTDTHTVQEYEAVGGSGDYQQANGSFWVVPVILNDAGNASMTVNANMFALVGRGAVTYSPSLSADSALTGVTGITENSINPGVDFHGAVVFEMPVGMKPSQVRLRVQTPRGRALLHIN